MWRRSIALLACILVASIPRVARASSVLPSLEIERARGAEACPEPTRMMARLQSEGSWRVAEPGKGDVKLVLYRRDNRYYARIEIPKASSERTLTSNADECTELAESAVVALSMMSDEADALWATKPPPKAPPPPPSVDARPGFQPTLEVGAVAGFFMVRPVSLGAELRLSLTHGRTPFSAAVGGSILPSTEVSVGSGSVALRALTASMEACVDAVRNEGTGVSYLYFCARGEVGALHAEGRGYASLASVGRPWAALGAAMRGRLPVADPLRLVAGLVAEAPLAKEQFQIAGVGIAYEPPPVTLFTTLGAEVTFP